MPCRFVIADNPDPGRSLTKISSFTKGSEEVRAKETPETRAITKSVMNKEFNSLIAANGKKDPIERL